MEVKNIVCGLTSFEVSIFSTIMMSSRSVAIPVGFFRWSTVLQHIQKNNLLIQISSQLTKFARKRKEPSYYFISNFFTKRFFSFESQLQSVTEKEIKGHDVILFTGEFTSKWLQEVINYSRQWHKPMLMRITGTIKQIPQPIIERLNSITTIIVHSQRNVVLLEQYGLSNIILIDQSTVEEKSLINLPVEVNSPLTYGYLGRLAMEKGIQEVIDAFKNKNRRLIIAGTGSYLKEVQKFTEANSCVQFLGELKAEELRYFFNKIDVLVIPSYEEAGPLVGVEAMAAGKIILSTRVGAMEDRLKNSKNQFWFDSRQPVSWETALKQIEALPPEKLISIGHENRTIYKDHYSLQVVSQLYSDAVQNALDFSKNNL